MKKNKNTNIRPAKFAENLIKVWTTAEIQDKIAAIQIDIECNPEKADLEKKKIELLQDELKLRGINLKSKKV